MENTTNSASTEIEPFGYFKANPFGWTDCAETDEGAVALYDLAAIDELVKQRDELLAALEKFADWYDERRGDNECRPLENARAAIDRVKGGTA